MQDQEVEDNPTLSPRTSTICLLSVEESLGRIQEILAAIQEPIETLSRRMDLLEAPRNNKERLVFNPQWGRRGRHGAGGPRFMPNWQE